MKKTSFLVLGVVGILNLGAMTRAEDPVAVSSPSVPEAGTTEEGAGPGGMKGPKWEGPKDMSMLERLIDNPKAIERLGLTDEQSAKLRTAAATFKEQRTRLQEQLRQVKLDQAKLMSGETIDEAAAMAGVEKMGLIMTEQAKLGVKQLILLKTTLTPEQAGKIHKWRKEQMSREREEGGMAPEKRREERLRRMQERKERQAGEEGTTTEPKTEKDSGTDQTVETPASEPTPPQP